MSARRRAAGFALRAMPLTRGPCAVPEPIVATLAREIDADAPVDARLLLADQCRAMSAHLRLLGAHRAAAHFAVLDQLLVGTTEAA